MAYINVDEVYILDNTGAQVDAVTDIPFKADAGLTDAQKAQARQNLGISAGGGGVNRNLLDNAWFTVNQRGWTSANMGSMQYWADRWHMNTDTSNPSSLSLNNGVVTITTPSGTNRFGNILQTLADPDAIVGKVVTMSVLKSDDTIISGTITRTAATTQDAYNEGGIILRLSSTNRFNVQVESGKTLSIKAAKLELGTVSTLANDLPPNYAEELAKCQRYFVRIKGNTPYYPFGIGFAMAQNSAAILVPLPVPMRGTTLTLSTSGAKSILCNGASGYDVSSITYYDHGGGHARLNVTPSSNSLTIGAVCLLQAKNTTASYIDLSADL